MPRQRKQSPYENSITAPTYQSASFYFVDEADVLSGLHDRTVPRGRYGRYNNPSWLEVEEKISILNGAEKTLVFASGMAAHFTTFVSLLKSGDHVVIPAECYRQTRNVFLKILPRFGITSHQISVRDPIAFVKQIKELACKLSLVHLEMPSSPHMYLTDIEEVRGAVGPDVIITLDSSFAPPTNFLPLDWGVDLSICSGTKYLCGHGDIVVGAVSGKRAMLEPIEWHRDTTGPVADGHVAAVLSRSIETLELRVLRVNQVAQEVAEFLYSHPKVSRVLYSGLDCHPHRELAIKYLKGHGGVVTFDLDADDQATRSFVDSLQVPYMASNFGAPQTLVEQSSFFTYFEYSREELNQIGVVPGTVRLAIGYTTSAEEIINDLKVGLENLPLRCVS